VVITRNGKPVAQIVPPPPDRRNVQLGTMRGRIHFKPGGMIRSTSINCLRVSSERLVTEYERRSVSHERT
jgi:antitoxin (DNA-binding transcriptional repressor) of toxin-antitoxin stability system